jgi:hypothetical protein
MRKAGRYRQDRTRSRVMDTNGTTRSTRWDRRHDYRTSVSRKHCFVMRRTPIRNPSPFTNVAFYQLSRCFSGAISQSSFNVCFWHQADLLRSHADVCLLQRNGSFSDFDPQRTLTQFGGESPIADAVCFKRRSRYGWGSPPSHFASEIGFTRGGLRFTVSTSKPAATE